ncbi:MAG: ParB/RepB/Spo0J family partition protein [Ruminococcaceae bacterium]|nr:ParB/RepB/Spo0J family partition protein [Oscillospiraceae bacterium]
MMAKKGLGKGLGSLIPQIDTSDEIFEGDKVVELKVMDVEPNKAQPRTNFDEEKLEELASSIKEHGVISPIIVKKLDNGFYRIIAGERRWRASKKAGVKTIPAVIRDLDEKTSAFIALIENLQREDLNPIEEAKGYARLMSDFELTQEETAKKVGKSRPYVANSLRILNLHKEIIKMIEEKVLSVGHAKVLLSVEDSKKQIFYAKLVEEKNLTVRELEQVIKNDLKPPKKEKEVDLNVKLAYEEFERKFESALGTKVKISGGKKKGKIEIEYYSEEDLERIGKILKI